MREQLLLEELQQPIVPSIAVKEVDNLKRNPVILAACSLHHLEAPEVTQLLLAMSATVDHKDEVGSTALMYAAARGDMGTVEVLLEGNADANERNDEGKSAFDYAKNAAMRKLLAQKMVERRIKPSKASEKLEEALEAAAQAQVAEKAKRRSHHVIRIEGLPLVGDVVEAEKQLRELLRSKGAGKPKRIEVLTDPITAVPTGLAYADYSSVRIAEAVMAADGEVIKGCVVRIFHELALNESNDGTDDTETVNVRGSQRSSLASLRSSLSEDLPIG
jgi:hypothetical protein